MLMRHFNAFAIALLGSVFAGAALAQSVTVPAPRPIPAPTEIQLPQSHADAARELLQTTKALDAFQALLPQLLRQIATTLSTTNLTLQADPAQKAALEASLKQVEQDMVNDREKLVADIALLYAARFSEPELRAILAFFKSPEGVKFIALSPQISQESFRLAQSWSEHFSQVAFDRVRAEMKKRNFPIQ